MNSTMKKLMILLATALSLVLALGGPVQASPQAGPTAQSHAASVVEVRAEKSATGLQVAATGTPMEFHSYGCAALLKVRTWQVAAFALGYCPSTFVLQVTPWGRAFVNWIVNGLCKVPAIVWAATNGQATRC